MKIFVHLLILNILIIQCQTPHKNESRIIFKVHKFDLDNDQMEVSFEIFNNSENTWKGGDWSLHWNQFSGSLLQSSLPEDVKIIPTKNSQYWQIHFGSSFTIKPGESLKLSAIQKALIAIAGLGAISALTDDGYNDNVPPVITVLGDNPATTELGQTYTK